MNSHDEYVRGFHWMNRAYYAEAAKCKKEIMFGVYHRRGGAPGEMAMRWHNLFSEIVPRLEVFCSGWETLFQFQDVLKALAERNNLNLSQEEFVEILKSCGFEDLTKYENPHGETRAEHLAHELELAEARVKELKSKIAELP